MTKEDEQSILDLLDSYCQAFTVADADAMQALLWFDDERFTEIEDFVAYPFGRERFLEIMNWIRNNLKPGKQMRFEDTQVFELAENVAYSVSLQHIDSDSGHSTSRVTLIYVKQANIWKILHGHFSSVPTD